MPERSYHPYSRIKGYKRFSSPSSDAPRIRHAPPALSPPNAFRTHAEAREGEEPRRSILVEQFMHMERRPYRIATNPAMMLTWATGATMFVLPQSFVREPQP
jgi:hypothetical protein